MRSATDEHLGSGLSVLCILVVLITKETGCKVDSERRMIEPGNRVLSISIVEDEDNDDGTTFKKSGAKCGDTCIDYLDVCFLREFLVEHVPMLDLEPEPSTL
jgi:hypothetical protein